MDYRIYDILSQGRTCTVVESFFPVAFWVKGLQHSVYCVNIIFGVPDEELR